MNLQQAKSLILNTLKLSFKNKKTLDKLSTADDGNLLFNGKEIKGGGGTSIVEYQGYSEEEKIVGKWTNGKPVYRITAKFKLPTVPSSGFGYTVVTTLDNVDEGVNISGVFYIKSTGEINNIPLTSDAGYICKLRLNNGVVGCACNLASISGFDAMATIEYTKTTDAENSFRPEMIGMSVGTGLLITSQIYSSDEIVIGRWTNGKPVYRKVIRATTPSSGQETNTASKAMNIAINANLDCCTSLTGFIMNKSKTNMLPINSKINDTEWCEAWIRTNNHTSLANTVGFNLGTASPWLEADLYITIEYTKTTDAENSFTPDMITDNLTELLCGKTTEENLTLEEIQTAINETIDYLKEV